MEVPLGLLEMTWADRRARYDAMKRELDALYMEMEERHRKERESLIPRRTHVNAEYVSLADNCPHPAADRGVGKASEPYCRFCNNVLAPKGDALFDHESHGC